MEPYALRFLLAFVLAYALRFYFRLKFETIMDLNYWNFVNYPPLPFTLVF